MIPRCVSWVLLACLGLPAAWAQSDVQEQGATQTERQRIGAERTRSEADFARQEQDCQTRFVVQACVDQVAVKRRKVERELKRQEAALNAADRQQRAQEQLRRGTEKTRDHAQRAAELPGGDGAAERIQAQQEKVQAHRNVAPSPSGAASKPLPAAPAAAEQASLREAYASKQRAAQERRAARDKRLRESTGSTPALPVPK